MALVGTRYRLRVVPGEWHDLWNSFVAEHATGHVLQSWEWGALKLQTGWGVLRLALWDGEEQKIVAGAQVLQRTASGVPLRVGHLAYIPKGPVLDWSQEALCEEFFGQLHAYLSKQGALALRMEPNLEMDTQESELMAWWRERQWLGQSVQPIQPLRSIVLDLEPGEEELLAHMKEKWRYNVRLSARKGVKVREATTLEDVQAWYQLLQVTGERDTFGIHVASYYEQIWELMKAQGMARLLLAEHEGRLLAGIFVSCFARQGIYMYGASSNEQRQLMPNYLLQWEAIRWVKQQGALSYDFWGIPHSDDPEEAMAGVYRFKSGWGGRVVSFPGCFEYVYRPLLMKVARRFM